MTSSANAKPRCTALVRDRDDSFTPKYYTKVHFCTRYGVTYEDGQWRCRQHSNEGTAARERRQR